MIIAYSHCIAHGYDMAFGVDQQKRAAESGVWPLYRFDPRRTAARQRYAVYQQLAGITIPPIGEDEKEPVSSGPSPAER